MSKYHVAQKFVRRIRLVFENVRAGPGEPAFNHARQIWAYRNGACHKAFGPGLAPALTAPSIRWDARNQLSGLGVRDVLGVSSVAREGTGANYRPEDVENIVLNAPLTARRRGRQLKLLLSGELRPSKFDLPLTTAIARAHLWAQSLVTGEVTSITEIARREGVSPTYIGQLLPLGFLAPSIVEAILAGRQPVSLSADRLIWREKVAMRWSDQIRTLAD